MDDTTPRATTTLAPTGPAAHRRIGRADFADEAVRALAGLLEGELPRVSDAVGETWVRHPSAVALYEWAVATAGVESALGAVSYLVKQVAHEGREAIDPVATVRRVRRRAPRWAKESTRASARHEHPVAEIWGLTDQGPNAPEPTAVDPLDDLPAWVECATGQALTASASERLVVAAIVAVDLAASDDFRSTPRSRPIGGSLRRRLAAQLDPPLSSAVARRSVARLLLGATGRPGDGVLSHFAAKCAPHDVAVAVRASWAADVLDLDEQLLVGRARPVARETARRRLRQRVQTLLPDPSDPAGVSTAG